MKKVLFVCRGNAFRSIISEAYLKSKELTGVTVYSRGSVAAEHKQSTLPYFRDTLDILQAHKISQYAKDHHADQITQTDIDNADILICINNIVFDELSEQFSLPENTKIWSIGDIGEEGRLVTNNVHAERKSHYEPIYSEITKAVDELIENDLA